MGLGPALDVVLFHGAWPGAGVIGARCGGCLQHVSFPPSTNEAAARQIIVATGHAANGCAGFA